MDLSSLISAIDILANPTGRSHQDVLAAQQFCHTFKSNHFSNLHEFFKLFTLEELKHKQQSQFWVLTSIAEILQSLIEHTNQSQTNHHHQINLQQCSQNLLSLVSSQPELCLTNLFMPQFARIYVLLIKVDHIDFSERQESRRWPSATVDLTRLVSSSQNEAHSKLLYRFLLKTMLTLDEECVERAESKSMLELTIANNVKDAMRAESVQTFVDLFTSVLQQYQALEPKTIRQTLKVCAQLIDWNSLTLFGNLVQFFKGFLQFLEYRATAFECLGAIVDKGMSEVEKINVLEQLGFLQILDQAQLKDRDYDFDGDMEDQETEVVFFHQVSNSIFAIGQWALQLYLHHTKILETVEHQVAYEKILDFLLNKATDLLDTDKPKIGRPLLQFMTHWIQAHSKLDTLTADQQMRMQALLNLIFKRFCYPQWASLSVEPEERDTDYMTYREELMTMFINLGMIKPFHSLVLNKLYENLQTQNLPVRQAETLLNMVYNLYQSIPSLEQQKPREDSPYRRIVQTLTQIDYFVYKCHLTTNCYIETMVRYCYFFQNEQSFLPALITQFFSQHTIYSREKAISAPSVYQLLRLVERTQAQPHFGSIVDLLLQSTVQAVTTIEEQKNDQNAPLGDTELNHFYNIIGVLVCCVRIQEAKRVQIFTWAIQRQLSILAQCSRDNKDKMARVVMLIKTVTKGLQNKLTPEFQLPLQQVIEQLLPIFNENCGHETLTKQIIYFMQSCIALFGSDILKLLTDFSLMCCTRLPFEQMEDAISMVIVATQCFKTDSLPMLTPCFGLMLEKAIQAKLPTSNTSDTDKSLIRVHSHFLRLIGTALEENGIQFMVKDGRSILDSVADFLLNHFYNGVEVVDKKSVLRHLKSMWVFLNPMSPITDLFITKKVKLSFECLYQQGQVDPALRDAVCNKIIEVTVRSGFQYHKVTNLESLQTAKVVSELVALIFFSDKQSTLGQAFVQLHAGVPQEKIMQLLQSVEMLQHSKNANLYVQAYTGLAKQF